MKKNIKNVIFTFLLMLVNTFAQNKVDFQTISIPEGLSSPNATCVYQDRFGYIWISTEDGLNRYDGSKIKIFRNDPDDANSLYSNSVGAITEDNEGYLWIGGLGLANKYNYATQNFEKILLEPTSSRDKDNMIISMITDSKGRIWAGTSGGLVYKYDATLNRLVGINYSGLVNITTSASELRSIIELKNGKILIADYSRGIYQYDEISGEFFRYILSNNFSPTYIYKIQEDSDGQIWFLGQDKLIRYNPNFYTYENIDISDLNKSTYLLGFMKVEEDNYVIISDKSGLISFNPKTSKITGTYKTPFTPNNFTQDIFGILWIAANGGVIKYDPNKMPFTHLQFHNNNQNGLINYFEIDKTNNNYVWLLSSNNSIIKYNLIDGNSQEFNASTTNNGNQIDFDIFTQDNFGNLLLASSVSDGVYQFNQINKRLSLLKDISSMFSDIFNVRDFAFDQNNDLFIATTVGLIYKNNSNNIYLLPSFSNRRYNKTTEKIINNSLINSKELAIIKEADELKEYSIDFSLTKDEYVFIRCLGEGRMDDPSNNLVWDHGKLSDDKGNLVFEMLDFKKTFNAGGGIKNRMQYETLKLPKGNYNIKYFMDAGHSYNHFNSPPPDDSTLYGIQIYQINETAYNKIKQQLEKELSNKKVMPIERINDVEVSRRYSNTIYLSSDTQGLFKLNIGDSSFTQYTFGEISSFNQKNWLKHCYEDITGNLWVATSQGLVWLNPDNNKWRVFTEKDGLPSNNILNTVEDKDGNLWVVSLGGLSKFNKNDPAEKWNFVNYDTRDGLTGYSFNGDLVKTQSGEMLFAVGDILHIFKPGKSNTTKPDIIINDLKISDKSVFNPDTPYELTKSLMETDLIELPFSLNDLSFNFDIIHYSRPYKNRLFYKLEGFNENWVESELGAATFTNLDPGNYEFKVRGISADGIRNDEGAQIKILISPPWWRTTAAYLSYVFLFGGLLFSIDRIQRRRILSKERNATAIREAELRARIAESENERKTKELEEARELQLSMLPKILPALPHLDIAVYMKTATEVGGDYYDFNVGIDGTLTVVIGDATGHGMKAGTMVTAAKTLFNSYSANPDILFTFHEMTRCIKQLQMQSVSMCLTMLKIKADKLLISSAGMPPMFIFKRESRIVEEHLLKGMPLGTMNNFPYEIREMSLSRGDTILLMSDGFPELVNADNELYGYKQVRNRFEEVAEREPEEIVTFLKNEGSKWVQDNEPDDDVTFVVLKVK